MELGDVGGKRFSCHGLSFPGKTGTGLVRRSFPEPVFPVIGFFGKVPPDFGLSQKLDKPRKHLGMDEAFLNPCFWSCSFSLSFPVDLFSVFWGIFTVVWEQLEPSQGALSQEDPSLLALSRSLSAFFCSLSGSSQAEPSQGTLSWEQPATSAFSWFLISVFLVPYQRFPEQNRSRECYPGRSQTNQHFSVLISIFSLLSAFSRSYQRFPSLISVFLALSAFSCSYQHFPSLISVAQGLLVLPLSIPPRSCEEQSWDRSNLSNPKEFFSFPWIKIPPSSYSVAS